MKKILMAATAVMFAAACASFAAYDKPADKNCATTTCEVPAKKKAVKVKTTPNDWKQIKITLEQLKKFDGKNGNPAYIAVDGVVYDVSAIPAWKNGEHKMGLKAGNELTEAFEKAPPFHKTNKVLNKAVKIGVLVK